MDKGIIYHAVSTGIAQAIRETITAKGYEHDGVLKAVEHITHALETADISFKKDAFIDSINKAAFPHLQGRNRRRSHKIK